MKEVVIMAPGISDLISEKLTVIKNKTKLKNKIK